MTDEWTAIRTSEDVTPEVIEIVHGLVDGWFDTGPIDTGDLTDRLERHRLEDGSQIDLGDDITSPAIRKIMREARRYQKLGL